MKLSRIWQRIRNRGRQALVCLHVLPRHPPNNSRNPPSDIPTETNREYVLKNLKNLPHYEKKKSTGKRKKEKKEKETVVQKETEEHVKRKTRRYRIIYRIASVFSKNSRRHQVEDFTDENHHYAAVSGDRINDRYELLKQVGEGSYSQVWRCTDTKPVTEKTIAMKILKNNVGDPFLEPAMLIRISKIQSDAKSNIMQILYWQEYRNHHFLVLPYYDCNLSIFLVHMRNYEVQGSIKMLTSVLRGMEFLHRHNIVHGDLKPANILFNRANVNDLKLADFGLSTISNQPVGKRVFQTTAFRAPEVILGGKATCAMDMWSFGIVLCLMVGKSFLNGSHEREQLIYMFEYFGLPPNKFLDSMEKCSKYFYNRRLPNFCVYIPDEDGELKCELDLSTKYQFPTRKNPGERNMRDIFPEPSMGEVYRFLTRCFVYEPEERILPTFALRHPLFYKFL